MIIVIQWTSIKSYIDWLHYYFFFLNWIVLHWSDTQAFLRLPHALSYTIYITVRQYHAIGMIGIACNRHIYTSICHNLTQTFSLLNQYKLHSNLWYRIFYLIIWNLWPQCVFLKVFSLIYYLCYVICIMHAFELQFELCNSAGSSLAQDRGRLESKIEAFNSEVTILKKNLEVKLSRKITLSVLSLIC